MASAMPTEYHATSDACCSLRAALARSTIVGARTIDALATQIKVTANSKAGDAPTSGSATKAMADTVVSTSSTRTRRCHACPTRSAITPKAMSINAKTS